MTFYHNNIDTAKPSEHFAFSPYHVESFPGSSDDGWHCVCNKNGFNCLSFTDRPGAKFTSLDNAKAICELWNIKDNLLS